ncbi:lipoprotein-releasing system transmembrane subunit LolE [Candidatus Palibaumannia cicadellinicola]|uniref:Lipoprotein-releasing system transmembrane subunit LolE n=1 Tax=Candidatus Palibaumannia cicadellinicola TaxID=186490 RepID=A0A2N4XXC0_9GAMM|nr:lipoprotein-releasing ABC transporter permease subunit LolE [Candidatus Baumannia cicadellinicola]PLK59081.1 lipoprotein-releasing system transmembrane subunit LolE [Candidatus Baumannia cicadellinicola]
MKIPLSLQIALRFNSRRQRSGMVSLISIISTVGISLGVMALIIVLSAINGFERELNQRILAVVAHGEIEPVNPPFFDWQKLIKRIEQVPGIVAATPYLNFTSLVEHDDKQHVIQVKGVDPVQEMRLSALPSLVPNLAWQNFCANKQQIIIGKGVADTLNIKQGDWLTMIISNGDLHMKQLQSKRLRLQVMEIFTLNSQIDKYFAMVPLQDAQHYFNKEKDINGIAIKVKNIFHANQLVRDAGQLTKHDVFIRSWIDTYGYMHRDIQMIRFIMYLAMVLVIGVACFNIVTTLVIAVKNKRADIAILRTLGAPNGFVYAIFIWYGLLISLLGCVLGAVTGVVVAVNLTKLAKKLEQLLGHSLLSNDIYLINFLPTELHLQDVISVLGTAMLLSLLARRYPAQQARRINPVIILSKK